MAKDSQPKFTHLHVHTHYSLLDGLSKIDELLDYTKELGMDSVAITDHGNLYGAIEFYQEAKKRDIKPIIGLEGYISIYDMRDKRPGVDDKRYHIILLAKNNTGYKNLLALTSKAHLEGFYYKPRFDKELLKQHSEGIIALSACLGAEIPSLINEGNIEEAKKAVKEYQEIFGEDDFYLEVQPHQNLEEQLKVNKIIFDISEEMNVPVVATQDTHYLRPDDAEAHDVLIAIQTGNQVTDEKRLTLKDDDFSLRSPKEMANLFKEHPEAIENTQKIAEKCNVEIELGKIQLPHFEVPEGHNDASYLKELCRQGLKERYGIDAKIENEKITSDDSSERTKEIIERVEYELSVIEKTGFPSYMLIVQDFVNWAKNQKIVVGPGRGSAAGSIVSYLLNVTNIDPIEFNLIFERFLNPDRISMPDIDLDFADTRRDEVLRYVTDKYGEDKVAQIITFGTMAARAAVRDAGRALGYSYDYCDKIAKLIPPMGYSLAQAQEEVAELAQLYKSDDEAKRLIDTAKRLEGCVRHASVHACGVVITKQPLMEMVPLQHTPQSEEGVLTQYEMHAVEDLGLLKMDFLGLKNLTIIEKTLSEIKERYGKDIDIEKIPLDDKKTYELLQRAETTGVFQVESDGMKRYLKELRPTEFEDIISMVALYRPGPMDSIPDFIAAKHGRKQVSYPHPKLKPVLEESYGVIVTQDQVLQIAREFSGFTYGEADILRKAVGKKIKKLLDEQKQKFIQGAIDHSKVDKETAVKVWEFIEPFARYGFNRAHAACYARIAYETAYLKAHYPTEFMASLMNAEQKNLDRLAFLIEEAKGMNIDILPPSINESGYNFTVIESKEDSGVIRFGLAAIKNVGSNIVREVIQEREQNGEFSTLEEFLERISTKDFNKKSLEALIKAGALGDIGEINTLLENMDNMLQYSREHKTAQSAGQFSLFGDSTESQSKITLKPAAEIPQKQKLAWEKELLGLYITSHPLEEHKQKLQGFIPIQKIAKTSVGPHTSLRIGAIINSTKKILTKKGDAMMFISLEDLSGKTEAVVFPSLFEKKQGILEENKLVVIEGKVSTRDEEIKILCDNITELS